MATRKKKPTQSAYNFAPWIQWGSLAIALLFHLFHLPGFFLWWWGLLISSFMARQPELTGKGAQSAANVHEEKLLRIYNARRGIKKHLWVPLLPPSALMFSMSFLLGGAATGLPLLSPIPFIVNIGEGWLVMVCIQASYTYIQQSSSEPIDPRPRVSIGDLRRIPRSLIGACAGGLIGVVAHACLTWIFPIVQSVPFIGFVPSTPAEPGLIHGVMLVFATSLSGAHLALASVVYAPWRERYRVRALWKKRFDDRTKLTPADLIDHSTPTDGVVVDTFVPHASHGMDEYLAATKKFQDVLEAGATVVGVRCLDEYVPGEVSNDRFRYITLSPSFTLPTADASTPLDLVSIIVESACAQVTTDDSPVVSSCRLITTDDSDKPAWMCEFTGASVAALRPMRPQISHMIGAEVLINEAWLALGALTDDDTVFDSNAMGMDDESAHRMFHDVADTDWWEKVIGATMRDAVNVPTYKPKQSAVMELPGGAEVRRASFVTRDGQAPSVFYGTEEKLATALSDAPFVSVQPFMDRGASTPGRAMRHPQAFTIVWAKRRRDDGEMNKLPTVVQDVPPGEKNIAQQAILSAFVADAFIKAKLAVPMVVRAFPMTRRDTSGHIWQLDLQLEGVTLMDVRKKTQVIQSALMVPWLRMEPAGEGMRLYVGAIPRENQMAHRKLWEKATELDWTDTWALANVVGSDGQTPTLLSATTLEKNTKVSRIVFELPPTLTQERIKGAKAKLRAAAGLNYLEFDKSNEARELILYSAQDDPVPFPAPTDFDALMNPSTPLGLTFGVGFDGTPRFFLPDRDISLMLLGMSGSGKSVTIQTIIAAAIARGYLVVVTDPSKGGTDFTFADPWYIAPRTQEHEDALVMLNALYGEVVERKKLHSEYGVGSWKDLPDGVRRKPILLVIDEFTSLVMPDKVPPKTNDPVASRERTAVEAKNVTRASIGTMVGRFLREARSVGVATLIGTQKLDAKTLALIPGATDMKANASRMILGSPSIGELQSALKRPFDAPYIGDDAPKGRGRFEPGVGPTEIFQSYYATQSELRAFLDEHAFAYPEKTEMLDLEAYRPKRAAQAEVEEDESGLLLLKNKPLEGDVEELEMDFSDLDFDLDDIDDDEPDVEPGFFPDEPVEENEDDDDPFGVEEAPNVGDERIRPAFQWAFVDEEATAENAAEPDSSDEGPHFLVSTGETGDMSGGPSVSSSSFEPHDVTAPDGGGSTTPVIEEHSPISSFTPLHIPSSPQKNTPPKNEGGFTPLHL